MITGTYFLYCFACTSNARSQAKFIFNDSTKVSVPINVLNVTLAVTEIKEKRAKTMFLPSSM